MQTVPLFESSIRCAFKSANVVTGFFLQAIRKHFYSGELINSDLNCVKWDPNPNNTKVWIDIPTKENLTNIQQRPMILIKRGDMKYTYHTKNGLTAFVSNGEIFNRQVDADYAIIVIGTNATVTEDLLSEVDTYLLSNSVRLSEEAGFFKLICTGISSVTTLAEYQDSYVGQLGLSVGWGQGAKLEVEALRIREIRQEVNLS